MKKYIISISYNLIVCLCGYIFCNVIKNKKYRNSLNYIICLCYLIWVILHRCSTLFAAPSLARLFQKESRCHWITLKIMGNSRIASSPFFINIAIWFLDIFERAVTDILINYWTWQFLLLYSFARMLCQAISSSAEGLFQFPIWMAYQSSF